jgi:DNA-binding LytR/AlgR family response regulator
MSIKIGICDDKANDIKMLSEALYEYDHSFKITTYMNAESLLEDLYDSKILFDILFLDIYMPGLNGVEAAGKIRARMNDTIIIFFSSSDEHYAEAYEVFAFNYLLKPIDKVKLNRTLDQALANLSKESQKQIRFSYKAKTYRIFCKDIRYIESKDKIIYFHMSNHNILQCYAKMDDILKQLPEELFIRCHQSFTVNIVPISEMGDKYFRIDNEVISISKKYLKYAKDKYFEYLFAHLNRGI